MTMFRLPMTIWAMFITAILQAFALPVLTAAGFMQLMDRVLGTGFFMPEGWIVNNTAAGTGGGQPLLWQHLFWFYSHPAVYIMILPAMGMVSDIISCFSRKPLFGYKPMVYSIAGIAGLGFIVWGHHMFMSGMNPALGLTFMVSTMMIALPSAIKVFNWLGTVWGGKIQFTTPMLFALVVRVDVHHRRPVGHFHGRHAGRYFHSRHHSTRKKRCYCIGISPTRTPLSLRGITLFMNPTVESERCAQSAGIPSGQEGMPMMRAAAPTDAFCTIACAARRTPCSICSTPI